MGIPYIYIYNYIYNCAYEAFTKWDTSRNSSFWASTKAFVWEPVICSHWPIWAGEGLSGIKHRQHIFFDQRGTYEIYGWFIIQWFLYSFSMYAFVLMVFYDMDNMVSNYTIYNPIYIYISMVFYDDKSLDIWEPFLWANLGPSHSHWPPVSSMQHISIARPWGVVSKMFSDS